MVNQTPDEPLETETIPWDASSWWLLLMVEVLAIPSLAFVIVTVTGVTGVTGIMGICVFMVGCWACTYFGMHLAKHPNMREKIDFTKK